ncbi:hypothetical protein KUV35_16635 [Marinobacter salsuginis]|uniref:hypothetical protein n=1 Tax=Marinobacter salsuginis TaxID=418719 RepID=UPI001C971E3C|nr:hypothetical protein [Marinobacter salsuginis]MBY6072940.1 hypothetical protein [Marinobacter salsuginis]
MSCVVCFFREAHQKHLKNNAFGIERFEKKLRKYKNDFIEGVRGIDSLSKCSCNSQYNHKGLVQWTDSFMGCLKQSESEICYAFDQLISIYDDFIQKDQKTATENLWLYLEDQDLLTSSEGALTYTKLLFRARPKSGTLNENEIREYFHIPFSKRHLVGNQRFSVSGQPMLYFGSSVLAVAKELDKEPSELAVAAFLPSYSEYYNAKIFSLTNHVSEVVENSLPGIFEADCQLSYDDPHGSPNRSTIKKDVHRSVLMQVCTFPVEYRGSFVAEYAIPQMLTTALREHGYEGIYFPSTKNYSDLCGNHRFSSHHFNLGLFVPYDFAQDTNEVLLDKFATFVRDSGEENAISVDDVLNRCDEITSRAKSSTHNNNDYLVPVCKLKLHIEYIKDATINGCNYFESDAGKIELDLYMKMANHLYFCIR